MVCVRLASLGSDRVRQKSALSRSSGTRVAKLTVRHVSERIPDGVRLAPMLHRVSLKTILIAGAILAALLPAVLISAVMVQSLHDSAIQEATARYELLAQGLASEHDRFLTSHRQAVQMLTRHLTRDLDLDLGRAVEFLAIQRPARPR
jgi:hypothetical protein